MMRTERLRTHGPKKKKEPFEMRTVCHTRHGLLPLRPTSRHRVGLGRGDWPRTLRAGVATQRWQNEARLGE